MTEPLHTKKQKQKARVLAQLVDCMPYLCEAMGIDYKIYITYIPHVIYMSYIKSNKVTYKKRMNLEFRMMLILGRTTEWR